VKNLPDGDSRGTCIYLCLLASSGDSESSRFSSELLQAGVLKFDRANLIRSRIDQPGHDLFGKVNTPQNEFECNPSDITQKFLLPATELELSSEGHLGHTKFIN